MPDEDKKPTNEDYELFEDIRWMEEFGDIPDGWVVYLSKAKELLTVERKKVNDLRTALQEIAKGEGRYSTDQLTHASNTIEDMKELALRALKRSSENPKTQEQWSPKVTRTVENILNELDPMDAQLLRSCLNTHPTKSDDTSREESANGEDDELSRL